MRLVVTSALDRFDDVVAEAVQAANDRGLPLEPATRANVEALLRPRRLRRRRRQELEISLR